MQADSINIWVFLTIFIIAMMVFIGGSLTLSNARKKLHIGLSRSHTEQDESEA